MHCSDSDSNLLYFKTRLLSVASEAIWECMGPMARAGGRAYNGGVGVVIQQGSGLIRGRDHDQEARRQSSWSWKHFSFWTSNKSNKICRNYRIEHNIRCICVRTRVARGQLVILPKIGPLKRTKVYTSDVCRWRGPYGIESTGAGGVCDSASAFQCSVFFWVIVALMYTPLAHSMTDQSN